MSYDSWKKCWIILVILLITITCSHYNVDIIVLQKFSVHLAFHLFIVVNNILPIVNCKTSLCFITIIKCKPYDKGNRHWGRNNHNHSLRPRPKYLFSMYACCVDTTFSLILRYSWFSRRPQIHFYAHPAKPINNQSIIMYMATIIKNCFRQGFVLWNS